MLRLLIGMAFLFGMCFTMNASQPIWVSIDTNILDFSPTHIPEYPDAHYIQKFRDLSVDMEFRFTPQIKKQILYRTNTIRSATEKTLGKTSMYFPIFEEYLTRKGMPQILKYLPIVESNLNPIARSRASAVGLWQFIYSTGRLYGLRIASYHDERSDTHKATDAATSFLKALHTRYNDWCLALAAYNCGPGRIDKLVRSYGNDYWRIRPFLPRETQMYVPLFMAVAYVGEYYEFHNLRPTVFEKHLIWTDTIHLSKGYHSLQDLAKQYGVGYYDLYQLNPVYTRRYVSSKTRNNILVLPSSVVAELYGLQADYKSQIDRFPSNPVRVFRRISSMEELVFYTKVYGCDVKDILAWNGLDEDFVFDRTYMMAIRSSTSSKTFSHEDKFIFRERLLSIASLKVVGFDPTKGVYDVAPVYLDLNSYEHSIDLAVPKASDIITNDQRIIANEYDLLDKVLDNKKRSRIIRAVNGVGQQYSFMNAKNSTRSKKTASKE